MVYLHYFATADSGLAEVLRVNPIKMLVYYNEKIIPIRRYDALDFFTQDTLFRLYDYSVCRVCGDHLLAD